MVSPRAMAVTAIVILAMALIWWFVVFGKVISSGYSNYSDASQCLWGNGYLCTLMLSLCAQDHPLLPNRYSPALFQAGAALLLGAIVLKARRLQRGEG